jgi:hypothetical protein
VKIRCEELASGMPPTRSQSLGENDDVRVVVELLARAKLPAVHSRQGHQISYDIRGHG